MSYAREKDLRKFKGGSHYDEIPEVEYSPSALSPQGYTREEKQFVAKCIKEREKTIYDKLSECWSNCCKTYVENSKYMVPILVGVVGLSYYVS